MCVGASESFASPTFARAAGACTIVIRHTLLWPQTVQEAGLRRAQSNRFILGIDQSLIYSLVISESHPEVDP
jgi:hypothetical protein